MALRRQAGEGSLYQRSSDGRWIATVTLPSREGKRDRRVFTATTMAAAQAKRQRFLDRRRDGFTMPKGRQPWVSEWVSHWFHNACKRDVEGTTWQGYRSKVEMWIVPFFERVALPELNEEDIEEWHRWLEGRTSPHTGRALSPSTIAQTHRILSTCIKAAVARGRIPRNPLTNVSPPRAGRPRPEPPSRTEVEAILARCATWPDGARWVLALKTGLRQGEALALRWPAVQLAGDDPHIEIRQSAARVGGELVYKQPKSQRGRRTIPLSPDAVAALQAHKDKQTVADIGGLVFTDRKGRPRTPWADLDDWRALLADLKLSPYGTHDCRHAVATMLLEEGVDPRVVQDVMGWSVLAMTEIYQHVRPALMRRAMDVLDSR